MIVPMKKISVVCLAHHQDAALHELQGLGVLHVQSIAAPEDKAADAAARLEAVRAAIRALPPAQPGSGSKCNPSETVAAISQALDARKQDEDERVRIRAAIGAATAWGDFDPESIDGLAARGIHVKLYQCPPPQVPATLPDGCVMREIHRDKALVSFAVVAATPFALELPETQPPTVRLAELEQQARACDGRLAETAQSLDRFAPLAPALVAYQAVLEDELAHAKAHDQLGHAGMFSYLVGFAPVDKVGAVEAAARTNGWGVVVEEPGPDDPVPTLIRNPRWLRPIETVFNFIDTFPGYHEQDISGVFFLFLTLFYAMLTGDAGYGMLYLGAVVAVHLKLGRKAPMRLFALLYVFNIATVTWGVITGAFFGSSLPFLTKHALVKTSNIPGMMRICFVIAAVHLTIAHGWRAIQLINSRRGVCECAWLVLVWGAFFLANALLVGTLFPPAMMWLSGAAIAVALVASGALTDIQVLLQFPFKVINFFGDTVSYLRLFAVGMAGGAIAQAFNTLALGTGMNTAAKIGMGVVVLVCGHGLNMTLGPLGVLVHGLRLNLLEFSGHLGQEWSGMRYMPFSRRSMPVACSHDTTTSPGAQE